MSEQAQRRAQDMTARDLTVQLGDQLSQLVREEAALAKAELFAYARRSVIGGELLTGAALAAGTCWLVMVAAAIAGIAVGLPVWAAALIVGAALAAGAGALALLGIRRLPRDTPLAMTIDSVRELGDLATRARELGDLAVKARGRR